MLHFNFYFLFCKPLTYICYCSVIWYTTAASIPSSPSPLLPTLLLQFNISFPIPAHKNQDLISIQTSHNFLSINLYENLKNLHLVFLNNTKHLFEQIKWSKKLNRKDEYVWALLSDESLYHC